MSTKIAAICLAIVVLVLALAALAIIRSESGTSETTAFVAPSNANVRVNQTFVISINVSGVSDLYGWEFKLGYNADLLEVVDVTEGSFLNSSRDTYFVLRNMSTDGYVLAGCTSLRNVVGVSGNGTLVTVEFRAKKLGSCTLDLYDTKLVNSAKQLLEHSEIDGSVTANGALTVRVQYADGHPVYDAFVQIWYESGKLNEMFAAYTGTNGEVTCSDFYLPTYPHTYWAEISISGVERDFIPAYVDENCVGRATSTLSEEITPPAANILSPQNVTYSSSSVPLTFAVYDFSPISWIGYSLDNQPNTTITGNTIINVGDGAHRIIVHVNDTFGNMGHSQMVCFSANSSLYEPWKTSFIGSGGYPIVDFAVYNGKLYAAADNMLYVYDGNSWNIIDAPTFVVSLEPYQDKLVVGGQGGLYSFDGSTFNLIFAVPTYIKILGTYNNSLYAGTMLSKPPTLYYCNASVDNPADWHVETGFSSILDFSGPFGSIDSFEVYNNTMYVTSGNKMHSFNGANWDIVKTCDDVYAFLDMEAYNGKLYLATRDQAWRKPYYQGYSGFNGRVIEYDGENWTTILDHDYWIFALEFYGGKLYVGTENKIYTYNGAYWETTFNPMEGAYYAISFITFNSKIYVGMGNGYIFEDPIIETTNPETPVVPEFPTFLILPLFMMTTLLAVMVYRRKRIDTR